MALVLYSDSAGPQFSCSGTLVSANVVLTAGHCAAAEGTNVALDPSGYSVVTGAVDLGDSVHAHVSTVSKVVVDPHFDPVAIDNDAALLVLSAPVSDPPIALWGGSVPGGTAASAAGWGLTHATDLTTPTVLQWAPTMIQNSTYCTHETPLGYTFDPATELCAVNAPHDNTGTCFGDSGGPLLATGLNPNPVEVGITSVGPSDCNTNTADYFTAVSPADSWIQSVISAAAPAPPPPPTPPAPPPAPPASSTTTTTTTTSSPTPPTLPLMTMAAARSDVTRLLAGVLHHVFARHHAYRISCSRVSASRLSCKLEFSSGRNDYYGTVTVFYLVAGNGKVFWSDRYTIRWVNGACVSRSRHPRACRFTVKRGIF